MRKYILTVIAGCFYYSGLVRLARWRTQQQKQTLVILNYHGASGGDLRRHLLYLRRHYRIMHLEPALEALYTPQKDGGPANDHRIPLVLTFDDGYRDNYTDGFALVRELRIPMTIFLIPGYIESRDYFWWLEGKRLVHRAQVNQVTIEGRPYSLSQAEDRQILIHTIDTRLRYAPSVAEREAFLTSIRKALLIPPSIIAEEMPTLPLTWEEVRTMEESGWVSFAAHTMHHPILSYLHDHAEMKREIEECRILLEENLGHPVRAFAYPIGQLQHIGENVSQAVQKAGYRWALTTRYGFNTAQSNPYLLRRIEADISQHWLVIAAEAAGLWGIFSRIRWIPKIRQYLTNSTQK